MRLEYFIEDLKKQDLLTAFDENVWLSMVDYLCVHKDGKVEFTFLDGERNENRRVNNELVNIEFILYNQRIKSYV